MARLGASQPASPHIHSFPYRVVSERVCLLQRPRTEKNRGPDSPPTSMDLPTDAPIGMDLDVGKRPRTLSSIQAIASAGEADGRASTHSEVRGEAFGQGVARAQLLLFPSARPNVRARSAPLSPCNCGSHPVQGLGHVRPLRTRPGRVTGLAGGGAQGGREKKKRPGRETTEHHPRPPPPSLHAPPLPPSRNKRCPAPPTPPLTPGLRRVLDLLGRSPP